MNIPETMNAVLLTGHGGFEVLDYRHDVKVPTPAKSEVLIQISAAGINNTDINTRIGWYSKSVDSATDDGGSEGFEGVNQNDATWTGEPMVFPRIQGADICGKVVAVGEEVDSSRIGERVLVRAMQLSVVDYEPFVCWTLGSESDGGFAQFATIRTEEAFAIDSDWSDAELASIPCAYSTAENMLHRANVGAETVLITGASGGVGSAAIQLAKRRGATVIAVSSLSKSSDVIALGADKVLDRSADLLAELGDCSVDVVIDLVAGGKWPTLLEILKRGGRYVVAGAIAGPIVELDVRTLYLKDLTFYGATAQEDEVFANLVGYIERNEIRPVVAKTYPLSEIAQAQTEFLTKAHTGKLVLIPPRLNE